MSAGYLFDTSFLVDLQSEQKAGMAGPATRTLAGLPDGRPLWISVVTVAEFLETAEDEMAAARRCAAQQTRAARRLGENDAWQVALAVGGGLTLVGHDHAFAARPGLDYLDHRAG
jgi:predicted nucleic acid-binding protein